MIQSKTANDHIERLHDTADEFGTRFVVSIETADEAIEFAEEDARILQSEKDRDRAMKAYCNHCSSTCGICGHYDRQENPWIGCSEVDNFLKYYDNEQ